MKYRMPDPTLVIRDFRHGTHVRVVYFLLRQHGIEAENITMMRSIKGKLSPGSRLL
jgi:hypothetical protein